MEGVRREVREYDGMQPGDPGKAGRVSVEVLTRTGRCEGENYRVFPLRLLLGSDCVAELEGVLAKAKEDLEVWRALSVSTDFPVGP